jgi:hypothetical protein
MAILVEVKRDELQRPTDAQAKNLLEVIAAGGIGILAWSLDQFLAEYFDAVGLDPSGRTHVE